MKKGIILVEVLLATAFLGVILVPTLNFFVTGIESSWFASREIKAQAIARESLEALRSVRERNWEELLEGSFYPESSTGTWQLVPSEEGETVGPFNRKIEILSVYRDNLGGIVEAGGTLDPSTLKAQLSVSWHSLRDRTLSAMTYLTRYLDNMVWVQTTQAEFDQGDKEYVETTLVGDGEVQLEGGCQENPSGAWIYDDVFQNTWQIHPSAQKELREITSLEGEVYEGEKALELSNFSGADTKLRNTDNICTLGFTRFELYVYNTADVEQSFSIHGEWEKAFVEVVMPPQSWEFISLSYSDVSGGNETNLDFIFFKPENVLPGTLFYLDNLTLAGGMGGYYSQGTLASSVFNAGRETAFNRISFNANLPAQTSIGFQAATANNADGPWLFYGPGGTTDESDLYTNFTGEGIWLGNNIGQYFRYKAYLFSYDGQNTPILYDVTINYAP